MINMYDVHISGMAKSYVASCLHSGMVSEGQRVKEFELRLGKLFGFTNALAVNSGTSALHLALICAGVKAGDEVILPAQTFVATGMAVLYCGATPVFADIELHSGNISVDSVSEKITRRTKAVICVSWGGNPCHLNDLEELCDQEHIALIQDNAHALGSTYSNRPLTDWGDLSCFSFQAIKSLTSGDGGLLVCDDDEVYQKARRLRWFGIDREQNLADYTGERQYDLTDVGYKYHMNDLAASLGIGNSFSLIERIEFQRDHARYYDSVLPEEIVVKHYPGSSHWLYDLMVPHRRDFMVGLSERWIPCSVVHVGIDRNRVFGGLQNLKNQRQWDYHHVSIPCHPGLSEEEVTIIAKAVKEVYEELV